MRIRAFIIIAATTAVLATGCGSGEDAISMTDAAVTTTAPAETGPDLSGVEFTDLTGEEAVEVIATDNKFTERYIEVSAGTEITFTNDGDQIHNVKPAIAGQFATIDSADFKPEGTGTITFDEPGDYSYYCSLHGTATKGMTGAIRVLE